MKPDFFAKDNPSLRYIKNQRMKRLIILGSLGIACSCFAGHTTYGGNGNSNRNSGPAHLEDGDKYQITDSRDGNTYDIVKIGDQEWMVENLDYKTQGGYCYKDKNNSAKKCGYGRLYEWKAAINACPAGFHLPSMEEWHTMLTYVSVNNGGEGVGTSLKMGPYKGGNMWDESEGTPDGTNRFGFFALPTGFYGKSKGQTTMHYGDLGGGAYYWSSTKHDDNHINFVYLYNDTEIAGIGSNFPNWRYSVRCVKDGPAKMVKKAVKGTRYFTDPRDGQKYAYGKIADRTWMLENLNYAASGSVCYNNDPNMCKKYGRLYPWNVAAQVSANYNGKNIPFENITQGICPTGWHIPSPNDVGNILSIAKVYGLEDEEPCPAIADVICGKAGNMLKADYGWTYDRAFKNSYSFSALPAGFRNVQGEFVDMYGQLFFWSTANEDSVSFALNIDNTSPYIYYVGRYKTNALSVRCVKD